MKPLQNKNSFKARLSMVLLVPLVALAVAMGMEVLSAWQDKTKLEHIQELARVSVTASALVHELQKERSMSAGFLGSHGKKFASELPEQRKTSDQRREELSSHLQSADTSGFGEDFNKHLQQMFQNLGRLDETRRQITNQAIELKPAITYYSKTNSQLLEVAGFLPKLSHIGNLNSHSTAYLSFLQSKERAGIERAVLAGTFAADAFASGLYQRFIRLAEAQDVYINIFKSLATHTHQNEYEALLGTTAFESTRRMRQIAMEKGASGGFGIDPVTWFQAQTQKINLLKTVEDTLSKALSDDTQMLSSAATSTLWLTLIIGLTALVATILMGTTIIRRLNRETEEMVHVLHNIASGDLTDDINSHGKISGAFAALASMQKKLIEINAGIQGATYTVRDSAREIAENNNSLAQRAETQAAHLEETAASMEEITSTVTNNADNSKLGDQLSSEAKEHANDGYKIVSNAVTAMNEINEDSKKIASIIGVIDDIAVQTNLLALNAAVEAARAGEQGRGFAVVATEVRSLALRSADAAHEIKTLIQASVKKIENGSRLVNASGDSLQDIVTAVLKVSKIMGEITAASSEQAYGVAQINSAVLKLDQTNQQNGAMVQEVATASSVLQNQSVQLEQLAAYFKTSAAGTTPAPPVSTPLRPERRSINRRPWSEDSPASASPSSTPAPDKAVGSDEEWEEF